MAIKHHLLAEAKKNQRHLVVQKGEQILSLEEKTEPSKTNAPCRTPPILSRTFPRPLDGKANKRLVAGEAVAEAARTLGNLLLGDGDDVDVDGVELRKDVRRWDLGGRK
jgi:hypothetical protein